VTGDYNPRTVNLPPVMVKSERRLLGKAPALCGHVDPGEKGGGFSVLLLKSRRHFEGYLTSLCIMPLNFGPKKGRFIHFYLLY
jgi:hypothetical protein